MIHTIDIIEYIIKKLYVMKNITAIRKILTGAPEKNREGINKFAEILRQKKVI